MFPVCCAPSQGFTFKSAFSGKRCEEAYVDRYQEQRSESEEGNMAVQGLHSVSILRMSGVKHPDGALVIPG